METASVQMNIPTVIVRRPSRLFWLGLALAAGVPRILGAFLWPNAFGDAYAYLQLIEVMRAKMAAGTFSIQDLYGFWFPLYQVVCAAFSLVCGHLFTVSKLVSAGCGVGVCLLVFRICLRLTADRRLSLLAFAAIAVSPLHILYSASALTDIPHALLVMASLFFVVEKRRTAAAIFAAAAGLVRIESWMLIALLPLLQFMVERKISLRGCGIMILAPLFWFYICWKATGNPWAYFEARARYIVESTAGDTTVATFSAHRLLLDAGRLLTSTNLAVLAGCLAAVWMMIRGNIKNNAVSWRNLLHRGATESREEMQREWRKTISSLFFSAKPLRSLRLWWERSITFLARLFCHSDWQNLHGIVAAATFFFANLGFLLLAYFTGSQPVIWTRYGLLFFGLGLPLLAWAFQTIIVTRPRWKPMLSSVIFSIFMLQMLIQGLEVAACLNEEGAKKSIAVSLRQIHERDPQARIWCEEAVVRYLSGIPAGSFVNASGWPQEADDAAPFLNRLGQEGVGYVVCASREVSLLTKLFPELRQGSGAGFFQPIARAGSSFPRRDFWIYRRP